VAISSAGNWSRPREEPVAGRLLLPMQNREVVGVQEDGKKLVQMLERLKQEPGRKATRRRLRDLTGSSDVLRGEDAAKVGDQ